MSTQENDENSATKSMSLWARIFKPQPQPSTKQTQSLLKQVWGYIGNARSPILRLPDELLVKIIDTLPVMSRACLSLSCKRFYLLAGSALASDELRLPAIVRIKYCWSAARTWRWVFLGLIQDKRWLRCQKCIKIRPIGKFSFFSDRNHRAKDERRSCDSCYVHGGIVYLCPCIQMSFQDKLQLISQLEGNCYLNQSSGRTIEPWHKCEKSYKSARVQVQMWPKFLEDGELVIETEYNIQSETGGSSLQLPYFCCPHRNIDDLVSMSNATRPGMYESCSSCDSSVKSFETFRNDDKLCYSIRTLRNLGPGGERSDITWSDQECSVYSEPFRFRKPFYPNSDVPDHLT